MAAEVATTGGARGAHDWHSPAYVREWVAENEARASSRAPQFDLLADFVPFAAEAPIRILDVGAGWGPVTRHLLARFPAAQAMLFDYSEAMFAEARTRLAAAGDRVTYQVGDLSQPGALAAAAERAGGPFDAVVSSSCLHNVRPTERIPALYQEIRQVTAPGGCFLNLDMVGTASPAIQAAWARARVEQARRRRLAGTGALPSYQEMEAEMQAQRRPHGDSLEEGQDSPHREGGPHAPASDAPGDQGPAASPNARMSGGASRTLLDHLTWLRQAGFDAVECFWRQDNRALLGGYVRRPGDPAV